MADRYAKGAAENELYVVDRAYLRETSLTHITKLTTEARSSGRVAGSPATSEDSEAIGHPRMGDSDRSSDTSASPLPADTTSFSRGTRLPAPFSATG